MRGEEIFRRKRIKEGNGIHMTQKLKEGSQGEECRRNITKNNTGMKIP